MELHATLGISKNIFRISAFFFSTARSMIFLRMRIRVKAAKETPR